MFTFIAIVIVIAALLVAGALIYKKNSAKADAAINQAEKLADEAKAVATKITEEVKK